MFAPGDQVVGGHNEVARGGQGKGVFEDAAAPEHHAGHEQHRNGQLPLKLREVPHEHQVQTPEPAVGKHRNEHRGQEVALEAQQHKGREQFVDDPRVVVAQDVEHGRACFVVEQAFDLQGPPAKIGGEEIPQVVGEHVGLGQRTFKVTGGIAAAVIEDVDGAKGQPTQDLGPQPPQEKAVGRHLGQVAPLDPAGHHQDDAQVEHHYRVFPQFDGHLAEEEGLDVHRPKDNRLTDAGWPAGVAALR